MEGEQQHHEQKAPGNVGGLIAEVENKMSELMAWHKTQVGQFENDKAKFEDEITLQREALKAESEEQAKTLKEQAEQQSQAIESQQKTLKQHLYEVEQQRIKLVELTSKLRAEESAMSREWGEVQKEREAIQKQAAEVAKMREQTRDRAKAWLETTASDLSEPLKLITELTETQDEPKADHHQEAA
ncbi:MAG: hypothetical protein AAGB26_08565 [Planctomycetota bacterium]